MLRKMPPKRVGSPEATGISAGQWMQSRKPQQQKETKKYSFMDSSSDESFSASHYIKNEKPSGSKNAISNKPTTMEKFSALQDVRPKTSHGMKEPQISRTIQGGSAVSRFAQLEEQILSRHKTERVSLSVSDLEISSDFEIKKDAEKMREERKAQYKFLDDSSSEEDNRNFVKSAETFSAPKSIATVTDTQKKESGSKKTVSFATNLVQEKQSSDEVSLDDFLPQHTPSEDEISSLDDILPASSLHNVRTLDEIYPDEGEIEEVPKILDLQTVDELLPASFNIDVDTSSSSSSITDGNLFNLHSVEELVEESLREKVGAKSPTESTLRTLPNVFHSGKPELTTKKSPFIPNNVLRTSLDDVSEIEEYSENIKTFTESSTQEIKTETDDSSSTSSISDASTVTSMPEASYTESFETESESAKTSVDEKDTTPRQINVGIQTEPKTEQTKFVPKGLSAADRIIFEPTPLVSNETLASLTTYSPAVLAVQDMLKQQLAFTRNFITRSENLHKSAITALTADYQYASLEEAREYIRKYKPK